MLELMVRAEEPDPPGLKLILAGLVEAVRPVGVTDVERLTVPVKPATLLNVMDEILELSVRRFTVVGLAEIVKSPTPTIIVAV
jgi:hypothetical protein